MSELKSKFVKGTSSVLLGQLGSMIMSLVTNIILARLLSPHEFGQLGVLLFFIFLSNVFVEGGLAGALIRKEKATDEDYSTVFIFNLIISVISYTVLFIASYSIAEYYRDPDLTILVKVIALMIPIKALQVVKYARLISELRIKQNVIYQLISVIIGSSAGLILGYLGWGVWSLVAMQLIIVAVLSVQYWIFEVNLVRFRFSVVSFKSLYSFGVNTTLASIINTVFDNIYQLILGKYFSILQVGYYYQGKRLQSVLGGFVKSLTSNPIFAALAKLQANQEEFFRVYNRINRLFLAILAMISTLLFIYAEPIITLLLGDSWINSALYLKILTLGYFFVYVQLMDRVIYKVFDKTRSLLYIEIAQKVLQTVTIIIGVITGNLLYLLVGFLVANLFGYLLSLVNIRRELNYFDYSELKVIGIISSVCALLILIVEVVMSYWNGGTTLLLLMIVPILFIYLLALQLTKVVKLRTEIGEILNVLRKK